MIQQVEETTRREVPLDLILNREEMVENVKKEGNW